MQGQLFSNEDVLLSGQQMVQVVACCSVDGRYALLVREGALMSASQFWSQWSLDGAVQYLELDVGGEWSHAALWQRDGSVVQAVH